MHVELAEQRVLMLADRFSMDHAEGRAWTRRIDAFGTLARLGGLLSRPRDEEFETVYRERRFQPFWHIACTASFEYERERSYRVPVDAQVRSVVQDGVTRAIDGGAFTIRATEHCREEIARESLNDAIRGTPNAALARYLDADAAVVTPETLAHQAGEGAVIVPPEAKASVLVREVLANSIARIEADRVIDERLTLRHVDLYYRPVYAFRYRWQGKEAVVEFDGVTGEVSTGGATFEALAGRPLDGRFLLNVGVEAAGLFIPGARLAEMVVSRGIEMARREPER